MQRSSESIGAIAAALAKAQTELTNPEKSLIATIRAAHPRENDQTFRYAALSSGLEDRDVQTTAIDKEAGLIWLTTTLSPCGAGRVLLSSEWPVCAVSETVAPRRMRARLRTRDATPCFTLVGITAGGRSRRPGSWRGGSSDPNPSLDVQTSTKPVADELSFAPSGASRKGKVIRPPRIVLATDQSEALRDRLVAELSDLKSADEAADWVHKNLPAKNTLTPADAETVEASFRERLAAIEGGQAGAASGQTVDNSGDEPSREQSRAFDSPETRAPETTVAQYLSPLRRRPFVCAMQGALQILPATRNHASSAAARPPKRTTFALLNRVRSTARSATSTRSRSAASIIASCTDTAMKLHGGPARTSIRYP